MAFLSFNEKAWDKVRPDSVKKSGVSEAIRAVEKGGPDKLGDLTSPDACTAADDLLGTLETKLKAVKGQLDAKKNADAVKSVTAWLGEVGDRRKMVTLQSGKIVKSFKDRLDEAQALIEGHIKTVTQMRESGQTMVSDIQDTGKEALIAGAAGQTDKLNSLEASVQKQSVTFITLRNQARNLLPKVQKEFYTKIPGAKETPAALNGTRNKLETLFFKVKADVDYFDELDEKFEQAMQTIENARKKGGNLEQSFVKVVEADVSTCQQIVSEAGSSETAIDVDLKSVAERLEQAALPATDPADKQKMIVQSVQVLKDAVGKIGRFRDQLVAADKLLTKKTQGYPNFVKDDNPSFKLPLQDLGRLRDGVADMAKNSVPKFVKKSKELGATVVQLSKG